MALNLEYVTNQIQGIPVMSLFKISKAELARRSGLGPNVLPLLQQLKTAKLILGWKEIKGFGKDDFYEITVDPSIECAFDLAELSEKE